MSFARIASTLALGAFFLFAAFAMPYAAAAQTSPAALPTAPGAADKAGIGGYTGARASLPGDHGSPLEPYLFTFILAGGGIIAWVAAIITDAQLRKGTRRA